MAICGDNSRRIPGVLAASLSNHALIGSGTSGTGVGVAGAAPEDSSILTVGAGFFTTMQIPLLRGREIDEHDARGAPMVAVVNEAFARRSFGDRSALGQHLSLRGMCEKCDIEIVGVSANTLYGDLKGQAPPTVYLPFAQGSWGPVQRMVFELRTAGSPLNYVQAVRDLVQRADPHLPLSGVKSQRAWIDQSISQEITFARLCTAFALLALVIAAVGLYGSMSYNVARRTGEIGIRMALGAQRSRVLWMVLREVVLLAAAGVAISVPAALAASRLVESFLFGMKANRSRGPDRSRGDAGGGGAAGRLPTGPPCVPHRSDGRAPARVSAGYGAAGQVRSGRTSGGAGACVKSNMSSRLFASTSRCVSAFSVVAVLDQLQHRAELVDRVRDEAFLRIRRDHDQRHARSEPELIDAGGGT